MDAREEKPASRFLLVGMKPGCHVAIPLHNVREISRPLSIESVSGAPAFVKGMAIIRSRPTPVVDLAMILGVAGASEPARFVMLCVGQQTVAVAVGSVIGVTDLQLDSLEQLPPLLRDAPGEVIESVAALDGDLLLVLTSGRLVPHDIVEASGYQQTGDE